MDYEKKYKEALELAKDYFKANQRLGELEENDMLSDIFPELKESEDERTRKEIIRYLKVTSPAMGENIEKMLDWLEKQGQTFTKKDVDDAYVEGMAFAKNELEKQYEATYQIRKDIATFIFNYRGDIKDRAKWMNYLGIKVSFVEKQSEQILANSAKTCKDEQKPTDNDMKELLHTEYEKGRADAIAEFQKAWSKEDESYLNTTIAYLKDAKEFKKSAENCINWLKSLKDRVQPILRRRHTIFDEII